MLFITSEGAGSMFPNGTRNDHEASSSGNNEAQARPVLQPPQDIPLRNLPRVVGYPQSIQNSTIELAEFAELHNRLFRQPPNPNEFVFPAVPYNGPLAELHASIEVPPLQTDRQRHINELSESVSIRWLHDSRHLFDDIYSNNYFRVFTPDAYEQRQWRNNGIDLQVYKESQRCLQRHSNHRMITAVYAMYNLLQLRHSGRVSEPDGWYSVLHEYKEHMSRILVYFAAFIADPCLHNFWRLYDLLENVRQYILFYHTEDDGLRRRPRRSPDSFWDELLRR